MQIRGGAKFGENTAFTLGVYKVKRNLVELNKVVKVHAKNRSKVRITNDHL